MSEATQGHYAHTKEATLLQGAQKGRRIKVVMLGAGSGFTEPLMTDILNIPALDGGELALVDIDTERLELAHQLIEKIVDIMGKRGSWTVTATTDRRQALPGADYIVNCIEVSGSRRAVRQRHPARSTASTSASATPSVPAACSRRCAPSPSGSTCSRTPSSSAPSALVLNYTNPMSMMCLAASRPARCRSSGCATAFRAPATCWPGTPACRTTRCSGSAPGINHLAWFTELDHEGRDLYPILFEKAQGSPTANSTEGDPVRNDMMLHFGAFITESSGHLSEYLPYYRKRKDLMEKYTRSGYRRREQLLRQQLAELAQARDEERRRPSRRASGRSEPTQLGVRELDHRGA